MRFTRNILKDYARLCNLSYRSGEEMCETYKTRPYNQNDQCSVLYHCNKEPEFFSCKNDSQMYICKYDKKLSVIFRGTESKRDVLTDLNIIQVKMPISNTKEEEYPHVHWGFYNQFQQLEPQLNKVLAEYNSSNNEREIVFSGHSLGGALATIAALKYAEQYPELEVNCVTFGSPRVGNPIFAKYFDEYVNDSYRFVNDNDPVPCVPSAWRYKHVKGCRWLYHDKVLNEITAWRGWRFIKNYILSFFGYGYDASKDHSCVGYCDDLDKCQR